MRLCTLIQWLSRRFCLGFEASEGVSGDPVTNVSFQESLSSSEIVFVVDVLDGLDLQLGGRPFATGRTFRFDSWRFARAKYFAWSLVYLEYSVTRLGNRFSPQPRPIAFATN